MTKKTITVYSIDGGGFSFRDESVLPALKDYTHVTVHLEYPRDPLDAFIKEAFKDLIFLSGLSYKEITEKLVITSKGDLRRIGDAWSYIKKGIPMAPAASPVAAKLEDLEAGDRVQLRSRGVTLFVVRCSSKPDLVLVEERKRNHPPLELWCAPEDLVRVSSREG